MSSNLSSHDLGWTSQGVVVHSGPDRKVALRVSRADQICSCQHMESSFLSTICQL